MNNKQKAMISVAVLSIGALSGCSNPPKLDNTAMGQSVADEIHKVDGVISGAAIYDSPRKGFSYHPTVLVEVVSAYSDKKKAETIARKTHIAVNKALVEKGLNSYDDSTVNILVKTQGSDLQIHSDEIGLPSKEPNFVQLNSWAEQQPTK